MSQYLTEHQAAERAGISVEDLRKMRRATRGVASGPEFCWSQQGPGKIALYHQGKLDRWITERNERRRFDNQIPTYGGNPNNPRPLLEK